MTRAPRLALALLLLLPSLAPAQRGGGATMPATTPAPEAAQFDFLVGQWEVDVKPRVGGLAAMIHGAPRLVGIWKAWRAFDGFGVDDELRIVDGNGNPRSLSRNLRVWDASERHWKLTGLDVYRARFTSATAQWQDGEMRLEGRGTDAEGKPYVTRTRFFDISADAFHMQQDRSSDDGQTWDEAVLVMDARRVAASAPR
jgi:hypothetical protein